MSATDAVHSGAHDHDHHADHDHHELSFWEKYVFSTDHKVIGVQYGITSLVFLAVGFFLMMVMRWSIAYPDRPLPMVGDWPFFNKWIGEDGLVTGDLYNMFPHLAPNWTISLPEEREYHFRETRTSDSQTEYV